MIPEDRVLIKDNLLQKLDELVWQVSRHEGLDSDRHILWVLCFTEGSLDHLVDELTTVSVLWVKDDLPEVWITTPNEVASLTLEERVLIAHLEGEKKVEGERDIKQVDNHVITNRISLPDCCYA